MPVTSACSSRWDSGQRTGWPAEMSVTEALAAEALRPEQLRQAAYEWRLTPFAYDRILTGLGRQPTVTEIAMFSVEWCEHCGYPKSRNVLRMLPNQSSQVRVLVGADSGGFY